MTDRKRKKAKQKPESDDVMHGRDFAGASYGATEREQTEDIERDAGIIPDESDEFITDAELDAREAASEDEESP
jgi:hypothetical protein